MVLVGSIAYLFAGILMTILGVVTKQRDELRTRQSDTPLLDSGPESPQGQPTTSNAPNRSAEDVEIARTSVVQTFKVRVVLFFTYNYAFLDSCELFTSGIDCERHGGELD